MIVADTNVLVSGCLTRTGLPSRIVDAVVAQRLRLAYDSRILDEYNEVLHRSKLNLPRKLVEELFEHSSSLK